MAARIHSRYLAIPSSTSDPAPMLVGFHGYGETAEIHLERLRAIPGSDQWLVLSIEALHHFYVAQTFQIVASWMTRQHRDLAIADNIAYVQSCLDLAAAEWGALPAVVFAGYSQGVSMAFRAALNATQTVAGLITVGGDVPEDITPEQLARIPNVLLARGATDELYRPRQFAKDQQRFAGVPGNVQTTLLETAHEWPADVSGFAAEFLLKCRAKIGQTD